MRHIPKVTVCVLTYNPDKEKLIETLKSIVEQTYADLQIIISDDGSHDSCCDAAKAFLDSVNFTNYKIVLSATNQGTVKNMEKALLACDGVYVKSISPGDYFAKNTILADWVEHLLESGRLWSFSDAIYYMRREDGTTRVCIQPANPQLVDSYVKHDNNLCRWNYVVLDDIALGAAILCERNLMLKYIQRIAGSVIYAEDNIYRMMMFHGIVADYFPEETVFYEYGSGISTSNNSLWAKRLQDDWQATNDIMLAEENSGDILQKKMSVVLRRKTQGSPFRRKIVRYLEKGRVGLTIKRCLHRRMTSGNGGKELCR